MTNFTECTHHETETLTDEQGLIEWEQCCICGEVLSSYKRDKDFEDFMENHQ